MDNASIYVNPRIQEVIEAHDCQMRYLPPYSSDFNPIELTFSVLKVCGFTFTFRFIADRLKDMDSKTFHRIMAIIRRKLRELTEIRHQKKQMRYLCNSTFQTQHIRAYDI